MAEPRTIISVGLIHIVDRRLLTVRSVGRDAFYLPGGKVEPGETLGEALVREVREELHLSVDPDTLASTMIIDALAHGIADTRLRMHCFTASVCGTPTPGREIADLAWFGPDDMDGCAPAVTAVLRQLRQRQMA